MNTQSFLGRLIAVCAVLAGCAAAPPAPGPLRVPADQSLIKQLHATGVQIYECQAAKNDPSRFEWSFRAPEATLSTKWGGKAGKHYAGPTWEAGDGSRVVGEVIANAPSSKPDSIAQLLLRAKATAGNGLFTHVQYIQRLNTVGGSAPSVVGCGKEQAGQQLRVSYTADYVFYGARH
jgi:FtsP/CotA-like multicopper oxidase with cupredoxin domain